MENPALKHKILIIDDEVPIRRLLRITLESNDYDVMESETGKMGIIIASTYQPEVILLDLGLPDMDGTRVLGQLREWTTIPVIVLTVRNEEKTMIDLLDHGADDFISKPFNTGELLARIRVAIRHAFHIDETPLYVNGALSVDLAARVVRNGDEEIHLTSTEYNLLSLMIRNAGKVLTHSYIIKQIWGNPYADNSQALRVHIAQLRRKIEPDPSIPAILLTEPGVGYRLAPSE